MNKHEISILNSLAQVVPGSQITKSLRHYNGFVRNGDHVTLRNENENITVDATVVESGDYSTNTVFIVS